MSRRSVSGEPRVEGGGQFDKVEEEDKEEEGGGGRYVPLEGCLLTVEAVED